MAGLLNPVAPADGVAAELQRWASTPFDLASDNCGLAVLAYAERARAIAAPRGRGIAGARAAARLMAQPEAFVAVAAGLMRQLGCAETEEPVRGDVGLVELVNGLTAAICTGPGMWAARGDCWVVIERTEPLVAWAIGGVGQAGGMACQPR